MFTDRRTDEGYQAFRKAHLSFQLRCAKKGVKTCIIDYGLRSEEFFLFIDDHRTCNSSNIQRRNIADEGFQT